MPFKVKLFPTTHVVQREEMPVANPQRESRDFSDPAGQAAAHTNAGYRPAGASDKPADGKLYISSTDDHFVREQNGQKWVKDR